MLGSIGGVSPKVWVPMVVGLLFIAAHAIETGEFNSTEVVALIATAIYGAVGLAAPPAKDVHQSDVELLSDRNGSHTLP